MLSETDSEGSRAESTPCVANLVLSVSRKSLLLFGTLWLFVVFVA